MKVKIAIERSLVVALPYKQVTPLLQDLERTIGRFPKLRQLTRIGDNAYRWDMHPIGSKLANISHAVSYGAQYHVDPKKGLVRWDAMPKQGNASIEGCFSLHGDDEQTRLEFQVEGELYDVPVPLLYRPIAPAFIQGRFSSLVDIFLERTGDALALPESTINAARKSVQTTTKHTAKQGKGSR